jgi:PAS domain S-box-containing protein
MDELEERQLLQDELLRSEEKYRTLLEKGLDGVVVTRAREYLFVNKRFAEMMGYSDPSELRGKNTSKMIDPAYVKHMDAIVARRQSGNIQKLTYETKLLKKDGSSFWVEAISSGIEYEQDQAVITYARDITDRKRMEDELRISNLRFKQFFENEAGYCYMISAEGKILDINESALQILGYEKEEVIGKSFLNTIYSSSSREKAQRLFEEWRETGELRDEVLKIVKKDGEERTVLLSVSAIKNVDGSPIISISVQRDITDWRMKEEAMKENN